MKSLSLTILAFLISISQCVPQGTLLQAKIRFANSFSFLTTPIDAPIFGSELDFINGGDWANAKFGNTPTNKPAGTQVYNGSLLSGLTVSFWAAAGTGITDAHLLTQGNITRTLVDGYFSSATVTFPGLPVSGQATVQVRVSADAPNGIFDFGEGYASVSPLFVADLSVSGILASRLQSFSAGWRDEVTLTPFPSPEPSSIVFIGLGFGMILSRRKW